MKTDGKTIIDQPLDIEMATRSGLGRFFLPLCIVSFCTALLYVLRSAVAPFAISFALAYLFSPLVCALEKKSFPRWFSSLLLTMMITGFLVVFVFVILPFLLTKALTVIQSSDFDITSWKLKTFIFLKDAHLDSDKIIGMVSDFFDSGLSPTIVTSKAFIVGLWNSGVKIINIVVMLICCPIIAFYMMRDWNAMVEKTKNLFPKRFANNFEMITNDVAKNLKNYFKGQFNACVVLAIMYSVLLAITGLHYGVAIGVAIGFLSFIPYLGFLVLFVVALFLSINQFAEFSNTAMVVSALFAGQIADASFITPYFVGNKINIHPVVVIFGLFSLSIIFGVFGTIFALPITAILSVFCRAAIKWYKKTVYYNG
jgi:predicted PurR-regulated permease PerM